MSEGCGEQAAHIVAELAVQNLSQKLTAYRPNDVLEIKIRLRNIGREEATHIFVSHMIRDYLSYEPDTLQASKEETALVFRLIRWCISSLAPNETAVLSFQVQVQPEAGQCNMSIGATYTFQALGNMYGPYAIASVLIPRVNEEADSEGI